MSNNELFEQMVQRLGGELKSLLAQVEQGSVLPAMVEGLIRQQLWQFGAQAAAVMLESADNAAVGGKPVHDHRTRTVVTLFGPIDVSRSRCQDGCYPLDDSLGLQGQHGWTAGVQEAVSLLSCECGFETVADLMKRLMGLSISSPSVQEVAEQAGEEARQVQEVPPAQTAAGKTLIMATDGCQAPERDGWHEVKVATVYTNESRCRTAGGRKKVLTKEYLASLEGAEGFARQLRRRSDQWEVDKAKRVVIMGDGAPWIWRLAEEQFPQAIEIVDFYHAVEHLWLAGEALFGNREHSSATKAWVRHHRRRLRQGRVDLVIAAMEKAQAKVRPQGERALVVKRNLEYFRTNRHRMRYDQFRRWQLPIGTGAVEGSCKFVVQSRFKRAGTRWSAQGLGRMLNLKLARVNDRWELLWPQLKAG